MTEWDDIKHFLHELVDDTTVPKNVKTKVGEILSIIDGDEETSIKVNKIMNELEDVSNDSNLQSYTRSQVYNIISMLEKIN
jgi:uncharacterized protein (UPF0147 family)